MALIDRAIAKLEFVRESTVPARVCDLFEPILGIIVSYRRHSSFSIGLSGQNWLDSIIFFQDVVSKLLQLSPHKTSDYLKGMRAVSLIQSSF